MTAFNLFVRNEYKGNWLCRVKYIIDNLGLSYLWVDQSTIDTNQSKQILHNNDDQKDQSNYVSMC